MTGRRLACGGKGPCCHVGYPHRHCEHCDAVIATYWHPYTQYPQPYWGTFFQLQSNAQAPANDILKALSAGTDHQH